MEKLDSSIIEAITNLRNNKKQPNENNIYTLILKDAKSLAKKDLEKSLMTLTKESKIINKPYGGKNSYFTIEEESDKNSFVYIEFIKEILKEMFQEQQEALLNIISSNTAPLRQSTDKLTIEIKDNNDRLNSTLKDTEDLKLSVQTYQDVFDDKIKEINDSSEKIKEKHKNEIIQLEKENEDSKDKLRMLEDLSRRHNLRFDGIEEWEDESWADTDEILKLKIKETLGIENIEFERAHRVGDKNQSSCRTIVAKLSKYKTKEYILTKVRKKKPQGIRIYEDFSKATVQIRKENWKKVKDLRSKGKDAVLVYDKIYTE